MNQWKRVQVEQNGKQMWVIPRIIIRNGFFWGVIESTQKLEFFKQDQIITPEMQTKQITKKIRTLKLM